MMDLLRAFQLRYHSLIEQLSANPRQTALTGTALFFSASLSWIINDFYSWKSFGTGGTPSTLAGYWRMTKIRVRRLLLFGTDDLRDASSLATTGPRYLEPSGIPKREGHLPRIVSRTMPQRQVPYKAIEVESGVADRVSSLMGEAASRYPDLLELRPSKTEGGTALAIYAKRNVPTLKEEAKTDPVLTTEIAHVHPADRSLHVWLTEADARTIVEKRWGMRFPLSFVDKGFVMVYSPRTMAEIDVIEKIVEAGIANVTGVKA